MKLHEEKYELCNFILAMKLKRKKKLNERTKSMKHHGGNNELQNFMDVTVNYEIRRT